MRSVVMLRRSKEASILALVERRWCSVSLNKITENPTDENILIEISNSIQKKWSTLLEKVKIYKKGTGTRRFDEESAESEGSDALKKRKEKTRTDQEFIDTNEKEKAEYIKQKLISTE